MKENEGNAVEEIPSVCSECKGRLNVWVGSHTSIRTRYIDGSLKWTCTNCWDKSVKQETAEKIRDEIESLEFTDWLSKKLIKYDDKGYVLDRLSINTMVCDAIENSKIFSKYGVK